MNRTQETEPTLENATEAGLEDMSSNPFVISYLQLCQLSYQSPGTIKKAVEGLPPQNPGGTWRCIWGPAQDSDQSILAYVAAYYKAPGALAFAAVVIRGTDLAVQDAWGVIVQMWEDLDVLDQELFPWMPPGSGALVAYGTLDALNTIQGLRDNGQRLLPFLSEFLGEERNGQARLVITGHSLGACLTTVAAPWLQASLTQKGIDNTILPVTFASPTAGNAAFAKHYSANFPGSHRYFNSLDIVPLAWHSLERMKTIYDPDGAKPPEVVDLAIDAYEELMKLLGDSYTQPPTNDHKLAGRFATTAPSWLEQALKQHHTTTYMKLLGGTSVAAEWPRLRVRSGV